MTKFLVRQIVKGQRDSNGVEIGTVFTKVDPVYAVYGTCERVIVQFADDDALGMEQRRALAPLNPVRGEINGLIDGWRSSKADHDQSKAKIFDRRVADALGTALQGDQANAGPLLAAIKADILAERTSIARRQYMVAAAAAVLVVCVITSYLASSATAMDYMFKALWATAGFGALGAFFSTALAIRNRSIGTDLQIRDNVVDAMLRILIGAISGAILFCLLKTGLVQLKLGNNSILPILHCPKDAKGNIIGDCTPASDVMEYFTILLAFIAGFSERMVDDLLSKATASVSGAGNPLAGSNTPPLTSTPSAIANEQNPRGTVQAAAASAAPAQTAPPTSPADDSAEGCLTDHPAEESEHTSDVELPEATGGVETPAAATKQN